MDKQTFIDIIYELIVVDSEEGLIVKSTENDGIINLTLRDGSQFSIKIDKQ